MDPDGYFAFVHGGYRLTISLSTTYIFLAASRAAERNWRSGDSDLVYLRVSHRLESNLLYTGRGRRMM
uniref:Uncharacterized protein n=1 Tax=Oryza barthii TaxID=65489 RepID=A0A0D3FBH0_9ORYZ